MKIFTLIVEIISGLLVLIFSIRISAIIASIFSVQSGATFIAFFILIPICWLIGAILIVMGMRNLSQLQKKK